MSAKSPSAAPAPESPNAPPPAAGSPPPPPPPPASSTNSSSPPPPSSGNSPPPPSSGNSPPPPPNSEAPAPTPSSKNSPPTPPPPPSSPPPPGTTLRPLAPPPPKMRPPPRSSQGKSPPSSSSGSSGDNGGLSTPAIIGIAVGGFVVVALILMLLACCCCRKRKKKESYPSYEITDDPPMPSKSNEYYAGGVQYQQARYQPSDAHINQPPPSAAPPAVTNHNRPSSATNHNPPSSGLAGGPSQTFSSGSFVPLPPPPPPPLFSSSEDSSNFSGLKRPMPHPPPSLARTMFTYDELSRATNGFSNANVLGQGGFGSVFKGVLPNGQTVAVKQLKSGSRQGEREFQSEVEIITRVHHRHLVSLIGYCIAGRQRLLVYEFVDNNTLDYHLHTEGLPVMDWPTRLKIAIGAARGLAYLHEGCSPMIIHRDIKSSNILLDSHFEAKVADFGLAKIASEGFTHISTRVMGTFGYLAPEYASSGKLTEKSDVFSFGIVLLELITGRKPVDVNQRTMEDSLVDWARPLLLESLRNTFPEEELVDPRLDGDYDESEMMRVIACAASAVRLSAKKRPRMGQIVRVLEGDVSLKDLHNGDRPGHSTIYSPGSSDYDINQYREDMRNLRRVALGTHEYAGSTGEFSETSDYGQIPSASSSDNLHERDLPNRNGAGR